FRDQWFYGDTLFIVDPWLWLVLGTGVILSRPSGTAAGRGRTQPARVALGVASAYVAAMVSLAIASREIARRELEDDGLPVQRLMVAPQLVTPLIRQVVAVQGDNYQVATFRWLKRPHLDPESRRTFPRPRTDDPALAAARTTEVGRRFLGWAR